MNAETGPSSAFESARARRAGLRRAMSSAEAALASPAAGRADAWATEVGGAVHALQDAFDAHIETTEAPDGILDAIVALAPRLANGVAKARREHVELGQGLRDQVSLFDAASPTLDTDWVEQRRQDVSELLRRLARHRQLGADLTYEAYEVDIGGED
jgi:hypothetical protein